MDESRVKLMCEVRVEFGDFERPEMTLSVVAKTIAGDAAVG